MEIPNIKDLYDKYYLNEQNKNNNKSNNQEEPSDVDTDAYINLEQKLRETNNNVIHPTNKSCNIINRFNDYDQIRRVLHELYVNCERDWVTLMGDLSEYYNQGYETYVKIFYREILTPSNTNDQLVGLKRYDGKLIIGLVGELKQTKYKYHSNGGCQLNGNRIYYSDGDDQTSRQPCSKYNKITMGFFFYKKK